MGGAMGESDKTPRRSAKKARCAIYTRKSSEEGLEQAFNSLDAQREACAAFILSQKHEGWTVLPTLYDDGGFSGGTMERPALKRLIADIEEGQIDVVVVYKVDRLTRALSDFAKLVDVFDRRGVSFVSTAAPGKPSAPAATSRQLAKGLSRIKRSYGLCPRCPSSPATSARRRSPRPRWCAIA